MSNLKPQEACNKMLKKLNTLCNFMDELIKIGSWDEGVNTLGIDVATDEKDVEKLFYGENIYYIFEDLKKAYDQIKYLQCPIMVEGTVTREGDIHRIGFYWLRENRKFEVLHQATLEEDPLMDLEELMNRPDNWDIYNSIGEYERIMKESLERKTVRVRMCEEDITIRKLLTMRK